MTLRLRCCTLVILAALSSVLSLAAAADPPSKPKVRAITGFVKIDRDRFEAQITGALTVLRQAKTAIEQSGYEVQSIRIVTQPFPEYTRGLPQKEALEL
jgi:hypothetical protein